MLKQCLCRSFKIYQPAKLPLYSLLYRSASNHPAQFLQQEGTWRKKDKISQNYELIYKAPMKNYVFAASTFATLSCATAVAGVAYYSFFFSYALYDQPVTLGGDLVVASNFSEFSVYIVTFFVINFLLKIFVDRFVLRLYRHEKKYIAIFNGLLPHTINKWEFKLVEFSKMRPNNVTPWSNSSYRLGKKKAILLDNYFKTPHDVNTLLQK